MMTPSPPSRSLSPALRWLLFGLGWGCIALGIAGVLLPVLPTTPFILLAAACFARSSPRFHRWLRENRIFGPMVQDWERDRSIPYRVKIGAITLLTLTMSTSILLFVRPLWLQVGVGLIGVALGAWLWSFPSRERPRLQVVSQVVPQAETDVDPSG